jgi:hypothetical protein
MVNGKSARQESKAQSAVDKGKQVLDDIKKRLKNPRLTGDLSYLFQPMY